MTELYIGVVGYTAQNFDKAIAENCLEDAFDDITSKFVGTPVVVSGLTNLGVPKLAYEKAVSRNWSTIGVACAKAENYEKFPVDKEVIVGDDWGDESKVFLSKIDVLIRVGGGEQSESETKIAKHRTIPVYEYEL